MQKMNIVPCIILIFCCFVATTAKGPPDNRGTEFVLGFTKNYDGKGKNLLFITCLQDTTVTVDAPGVGFKKVINLKAKQLETVEVPLGIRMAAGIENKGILITSTEEVIVYGISLQKATTDAYLALPTDIQSDRYIIASIKPTYQNANLGVVASQDGTTVTVHPPGQNVMTKTLNRLQSFYYAFKGDLTGTVIKADKPVSVFSGAECTQVGGIGACDHLIEQIPPVNTWGKRFATVPIRGRTVGDIFRIIASEDNTLVEIAAKRITKNINTGNFFEVDIPSNEYQQIICSKPCLVVQYNKGQGTDIKADPFMILIPPIEQYAANYVLSTSKTALGQVYQNVLAVAIQKKHKDNLILDGKPLVITWKDIPGTDLVGGSLNIADGRHELYHKSPIVPFAAYMYGYRDFDSYGYPGGLRLAPIAIPCKATTPVPLDGIDNDCDGLIDEELKNGKDDDGDGKIDEDIVALPPTLTVPKDYTALVCDYNDKTTYTPNVAGQVIAKASDKCELLEATKISHSDKELSRANCVVVIQRVWSVLDGCKNTVEHVQKITLTIKEPQVTVLPTAELVCKNANEVKAKTAWNPKITSNPCPGNIVTIAEKTVSTAYNGVCRGQTISRTWEAKESCGRTKTLTQKVKLVGQVPPSVTNPKDYTAEICDLNSKVEISPVKTGQLTAKAHSECEKLGATTVNYVDNTVRNSNCEHHMQRTWTVRDGCGQTINHVQNIRLIMKKPTVTVTPTASMICSNVNEVKGRADLNPKVTTNPCPGNKVTFTETTPAATYAGKCSGQTITRMWQTREACGRISTLTQKVVVLAKVPPRVTKPKDYTAEVCDLDSKIEIATIKTGQLTAKAHSECEKLGATKVSYADKTVRNSNCEHHIQRTWTVGDGCSHTINHVQNIKLIMKKNTVAVTPTASMVCSTVNDVKGRTDLNPKVTSNPCPGNTVTFTETTPSTTYAGKCSGQTVTRTWQAKEACGRTSTLTQKVVVLAKVPPSVTKPKDYTTEICDLNSKVEIATTKTGQLTAKAHSECEKLGASKVSYADKTVRNSNCEHHIQRTWTVRDGCSHTINHVQNIKLIMKKNTVAVTPTASMVCSTVNDVKGRTDLNPKVTSNPCPGNTVTFTETTPSTTYAGKCSGQTVTRTWQAKEACGRTSTLTQKVVVLAKVPPSVTKPKDYTTEVCDLNNKVEIATTKTGQLAAKAHSECEKLGATKVSYADKTVRNSNCEHHIQRTWTVRDGCSHTINHVQNIKLIMKKNTVAVTPTASMVCSSVNDVKGRTDLNPKVTNNPCPGNTVTFTETTPSTTYAGKCSGQTVTRTWQAKEACGRTSTLTQKVVVLAKVPPSVTKPKDYTTEICDLNSKVEIATTKTGQLTAKAHSECEKLGVTKVSYADKTVRNSNCEHHIQRTWTVRDGCSHTINHVQNIKLIMKKNTVAVTPTASMVCNTINDVKGRTDLNPKVTSNPCPGNTVTFTETTPSTTYAGKCSGQTVTRTWQAKEACGRTSTLTQKIVALAKVPPSITTPKDYTTTVCDLNSKAEIATVKTGQLTAKANSECEKLGATKVSYADKTVRNSNCEHHIQRTWTVRDGCNHIINHVQNIKLMVKQPTVTVTPKAEIVCSTINEVKGRPDLDPKLTSNPCPANKITITDSTVLTVYGTACSGQTVNRVWTVTEDCGRSKTISQQVVVKAKVPPKLTKPKDYKANVCDVSSVAEIDPLKTGRLTAVVSPDCENLEATKLNYADRVLSNANCQKIIERTWSLRDGCGHTDSHVQKITLVIPEASVSVASKAEYECEDAEEAFLNTTLNPRVIRNPCPVNTVTFTETTAKAVTVGECKDQVVTRTWTATEKCGRTKTLSQELTLTRKACYLADIVFALDNSGSLTQMDFQEMMKFVKNVISVFDIRADKTRVGVLTYEDQPNPQFELNSYYTKSQILAAVDNIKQTFGATKTDEAIEYMKENSFTAANGDRILAKNIGIVITDGQSGSRILTALQARLAKEAGLTLFAIGVGASIDINELKDIASDPDSSYMFTVDNFAALKSIEKEVAIGTCIATNPTTVPTTTTTTTVAPTVACENKHHDCASYGRSACTDYAAWAKDNCYLYCGYCGTPTPEPDCVDKQPNCVDFGISVCSSPTYILWANENCRAFCGFCTPQATTVVKVPTIPPTPAPTPPSATSTPCEDKITNCDIYKREYCTQFGEWARENCPRFCGICTLR